MSIDKIYFACVDNGNFGDALSVWLPEKLTGERYGYSGSRELIISGSVLVDAFPQSVVYGAGFINMFQSTQARYISYVRGHLTALLLQMQGNSAEPEIFEPAYCLREFYEDIVPDVEVGYIPHYVDAGLIRQDEWMEIGICTGIDNVMRQMLRCKKIVTSSLHGMVIADLFERPSCLVQVSNNLTGDGFKFIDYWSFVDKPPYRPIPVQNKEAINRMLELTPKRFDKGSEAKSYLSRLHEYLKTI